MLTCGGTQTTEINNPPDNDMDVDDEEKLWEQLGEPIDITSIEVGLRGDKPSVSLALLIHQLRN